MASVLSVVNTMSSPHPCGIIPTLSIGMPNKTEAMRSEDLITLISAHRMVTIATIIHVDPAFFAMIEEYKERVMAAKIAFNLKDERGTRGRSSAEARKWAAKQIRMSTACTVDQSGPELRSGAATITSTGNKWPSKKSGRCRPIGGG